MSVSFLWTKKINKDFFTCERNSDYFFSSRINFSILVFLLFLYHSFHYPCYYLKFSISCICGLALHDMRFHDSRYNRHNAHVRSVRKSCSYIKIFNLFLFVPGYSVMRHAIPGLLLDILQRTTSWRRFLWWRSWLVKNLSTLMGYTTILYWWEPHPIWLYCRGKTQQGGILWMLKYPK